jgi:hypothetical protein
VPPLDVKPSQNRTWWWLIVVAALCALSWSWSVADNPTSDPSGTLEATLHPPSQVEAILRRSCYDCHSNSTDWPWFIHFRPFAAKIRRDVADGRKGLNFSEWRAQTGGNPQLESRTLATSCSLMQAGMMPPRYYSYVHPGAAPSSAEVKRFCRWANETSNRLAERQQQTR